MSIGSVDASVRLCLVNPYILALFDVHLRLDRRSDILVTRRFDHDANLLQMEH